MHINLDADPQKVTEASFPFTFMKRRSYKAKGFTAVNFFQFLVIKTLDSELDPDPELGKLLDPYPH